MDSSHNTKIVTTSRNKTPNLLSRLNQRKNNLQQHYLNSNDDEAIVDDTTLVQLKPLNNNTSANNNNTSNSSDKETTPLRHNNLNGNLVNHDHHHHQHHSDKHRTEMVAENSSSRRRLVGGGGGGGGENEQQQQRSNNTAAATNNKVKLDSNRNKVTNTNNRNNVVEKEYSEIVNDEIRDEDDEDDEDEDDDDEDEEGGRGQSRRRKIIFPGYVPIAFKYLTQASQPRFVCLKMITSPWFERISMFVILVNCITLGMYQPCNDNPCKSPRCSVLQYLDHFIFVFFGIEMCIKLIAMGFWGKDTYLADTWNRLDMFIVFAGYIDFLCCLRLFF